MQSFSHIKDLTSISCNHFLIYEILLVYHAIFFHILNSFKIKTTTLNIIQQKNYVSYNYIRVLLTKYKHNAILRYSISCTQTLSSHIISYSIPMHYLLISYNRVYPYTAYSSHLLYPYMINSRNIEYYDIPVPCLSTHILSCSIPMYYQLRSYD